jgi:hypothetical protein
MPAASLRALLEQSIDYAGMFPPCSLELGPALTHQTRYVHLPDSWLLNAFVLPVGKFDAASKNAASIPLRRTKIVDLHERHAGRIIHTTHDRGVIAGSERAHNRRLQIV